MIDLKAATQATKSFTIPMSSIRVASRNMFEVNGKPIKVADSGFKDMLKLVGLSNKTVSHINEELQRDAGYLLIKELMRAMSTKKGTNITLLIDESDKEVKRICLEGDLNGGGSAISPQAIEDLITYAMDKSDRIKLANTFISDGGTKVTFNLKWDSPISLPMRGEDITLGKQITWDMLGPTSISDFVERQICTNGMTSVVPGKAMFLDSHTDPSEWYKQLYKDIINPNKNIIAHYQDKAYQAMKTNLSVYEYNQVRSHVLTHWKDDMPRIQRFLGLDDWKYDYEKSGIDLTKATAGQLKNCPTPINAWDAINCLTDFSSHKYNSVVSDKVCRDTQRMAGRLLNKAWDESQQIHNTPVFKNSGPAFSIN
jgi:hypothetical protein